MTTRTQTKPIERTATALRWVIFDIAALHEGGQTYFTFLDTDDGRFWTLDPALAHRFETTDEAQAQIEECDPGEIFRDRFVIWPVI